MALHKHGIEKQLKEREAWLDATLNSIGDAVIATDTGGSITSMNPVAAKLTGWTFKDAEGKPLAEVFNIVNARTRKKAVTPVKKVLEKGKIVGLANHTMLIAKDGTEYQIADSASPIRDSSGNNMGVVLVFRDVTEEYRIQEALRESEEKMRAILDSSPDVIHLLDINGIILSSNEGFAKRVGLEIDDTIGKSVFDYAPEESIPGRKAAIDKVFRTGEPLQLEDRGRTGVFESHLQPVFNPAGEVTAVAIYARDITERKLAEQELIKERTLLKAIVDGIPVLLTHYDPGTNMLYLNNEFEKIVGWKTEEVKSIDMMEKVYPDPDYRKKAAEYMQKASAEWKEFRILSKSGKIIDSEWSNIRLDDGTQIGIGIDITERKRAEEALSEAHNIINRSPAVAFLWENKEGWPVEFVSENVKKLTGYSSQEFVERKISYIDIIHSDDLERVSGEVARYSKKESLQTFAHEPYRIKAKNGDVKWIDDITYIRRDSRGIITYYEGIVRDITEHKRAEDTLRIERDNLKNIFEAMEDGIYIVNQQYDIQYVNPVLKKDFGIYEGRKCYEYFHDRKEACPWCKNPDVFAGKTVRWEWYSVKNLKTYDLIDTPLKNPDGSISKLEIFRDITKRKQAEEQILRNLREKEVMIKEIHHRVKNNMQIISSLLRLQLEDIQDEEARDRLKRAGTRIRSIALVHEELYKSENLAEIDFSIYISRLATHILSIYSKTTGEIDLELDLEEIYLNINTAIPMGLVANELLSNSVVHGFPSGHLFESKKRTKNKIMISLGSAEDGKRIMEIRDNGVGIPRDLDYRKPETLGLQIVMDLVKQIHGTIKLYRREGTTWKITF